MHEIAIEILVGCFYQAFKTNQHCFLFLDLTKHQGDTDS